MKGDKMGYTHYFKIDSGNEKFKKEVIEDIKKIIGKYSDILQYENDVKDRPLINEEIIHFNGIDNNGHETFYLTPNCNEFCKTARKPYDLPTCEILLILKHHYGDKFVLSSDWFWVSKKDFKKEKLDENWNEAIKNVFMKFGYAFKLIPKITKRGDWTYYNFNIQ